MATGEVIHECLPRPRHQEFLRLLRSVGTASFFAYIAGDDALWVIDVAAGTRTRVGAFKSGARPSWID